MVETPAVALLFEDVALGDHLRNALQERGARIVHEGGLAGLSAEQLHALGADVLVVNLEDDDDAAFDRLYEVLEGDRPQVVFNDAQASRKLDGWDRARWARHLAAKVLAIGDVDPPRPADAVPFIPAPAMQQEAPQPPHETSLSIEETVAHQQTVAASETLAAELEALLAANDTPEEAGEFGEGLNYAAGEDVPLEDGDFGGAPLTEAVAEEADSARPAMSQAADVAAYAPEQETPVVAPDPVPAAGPQLDQLALAPLDGDSMAATAAASIPADRFAAPRSPDSWSLVEDGDEAPATPDDALPDASAFGIQKVSAADYLAPDTGDTDGSPIVLGMSLELVSMEEAIAPREYDPEASVSEMLLDESTSVVLGQLVVLGATTESTASVCQFLSSLPGDLRQTILHTQHLSGKPADALVEYLGENCALPVRLAEPGRRARPGEVLVVPSDRQVRVLRDGSIMSEPAQAGGSQVPSIDASFTMAAGVFGRDALAIVFAGHSTDAFGGCQAIHDRGGQVWVEGSRDGHFADMVGAVVAERLSNYAGTPQELAAHLVEHFTKEGRA